MRHGTLRFLPANGTIVVGIGLPGSLYGTGAHFLAALHESFRVLRPLRTDLAAAVPFYGAQPGAADADKIKAPLLLHYAALDERIDAGWPAYEQALKAAGVKYQMYMYPGTNHGFHNDTTPRYDEAAAKLAWSRTIAFFKQNVTA